jgi:ABC-2 type transport system ATP-binding protein
MNTVIELRDVSLRLGGAELFSGATAEFERGRTYGIVGPNGVGKSVLFKLICGFLNPTSGEVWIDPALLSPRRTFPDRFGLIINGPAYLGERTGLENLAELAKIRRLVDVRKLRATMLRVGLDAESKQRVRNYSLGMKQKLALAQALMEDPDVYILDEPFNALDASSTTRAKDILRELQASGKTILFTSHNAADIDELSDCVLEIDDRRLASRQ